MKLFALIALAHLGLLIACGQSGQTTVSSLSNTNKVEITPTPLPVRTSVDDADRICARGKCRVDTSVDGQLESQSYYSDGKSTRYLLFDTSTGKLLIETAFLYDESDNLIQEKLIRGGDFFDDSSDARMQREHDQKEFDFTVEQLRKAGMAFPMPDLLIDEVKDLSTILFAIRNPWTAPSTPNDAQQKSGYSRVELNDHVTFRSPVINSLVGEDPVLVKSLEVNSKNSLPTRETIVTGNGALRIEFSYADGNVKRVFYRFTRNGKLSTKSKEFVYVSL